MWPWLVKTSGEFAEYAPQKPNSLRGIWRWARAGGAESVAAKREISNAQMAVAYSGRLERIRGPSRETEHLLGIGPIRTRRPIWHGAFGGAGRARVRRSSRPPARHVSPERARQEADAPAKPAQRKAHRSRQSSQDRAASASGRGRATRQHAQNRNFSPPRASAFRAGQSPAAVVPRS